VHSAAIREAALELIVRGESDCEVARRLELPRSTVRGWRQAASSDGESDVCPRCWGRGSGITFTDADYAELLGLYLGDGHITALERTHRLRLSLDARYSRIVAETEALLQRCFPANRVGRVAADRGSTIVLHVHSRHLPCLFPQHGRGKKHERRIVLEPWQRERIEAAPWSFVRGCIRSDGCCFVNRTGRYEYLTYHFSNHSADIRELFVGTCAGVGIECRVSGRHVRVNRRASVRMLLEHVGTKC
jgi:hypothetical protein